MPAIGGLHCRLARLCALPDHLPQTRPTHAELAAIGLREWRAGKIEGRVRRRLYRQLAQVVGHPGALFQLLRRPGQPLAQLGPRFQISHYSALRPANVVDASGARPRYSNSSNVAAYPLPGHSPLAAPAAIALLRPIPYLNRSTPAAMAEETPDV